jgi:hypothetical protein
LATGAGAPAVLAAAPPASPLNQRSYSGRVGYVNDSGEIGHEVFTVTIQPNGLRTMRAMCELGPEQLLRDVMLTVDGDWRPKVGFVQLTLRQQFEGASWYHFDEHVAECEGVTQQQGRFSQSFPLEGALNAFGAHPVHCDAWKLALVRKFRNDPGRIGPGIYSTSSAPMGASGPGLLPLPTDFATYEYLGPEKVRVPAGTFAGEHFRFTVTKAKAVIDVWAYGEDCIPLRLSVVGSKQHYELTALGGNPR